MKKRTIFAVVSFGLFLGCSLPEILNIDGGNPDALTPIARWDVVPNQRITKGETLNVGLVAFSKAGIDRVIFSVSGQVYSGMNPVSAAAMTHNVQTKVYEYWFPLSADSFSTNGVFTIQAIAYGKDGGTLDLPTYSFVVNATGTLAAPEAWVSATGNNTTGKVNDRSLPFLTPGAAVTAIQGMNGGSSDGATIYLMEGSYHLGTGTTLTTNEWITITKDQAALKANTNVTDTSSVVQTGLLRFKDVTISQGTPGDTYLLSRPSILWIDSCVINGGGRWTSNSNPTNRSGTDASEYPAYFTDTEIYDVDFGIAKGMLARNVTIKRTGNDPFVNVLCIINAVVEDIDPGTTYWHADGYQSHGPGPVNRIIYGYFGTNLHYQGLYMRQTFGNPARNNAFVNMFIEMREPGRLGSSSATSPQLNSGGLTGAYDHFLMWNCSFLGGDFTMYDEPDGAGVPLSFANSSFIGNVFYHLIDYTTEAGKNPPYALPGNSENNVFLDNHYMYSNVDQGGGSAGLPFWFSISPDSGVNPTHTFGDPKIVIDTAAPIGTLGVPNADSPLLNRFSSLVPTDALGRLRGETSDIGALER